MKKKFLILASMVLAFSGLIGLLPTQTVGATRPSNDKVRVCHATASAVNPYNSETPSISSYWNGQGFSINIANGHGTNSGTHGGDIIPEFWYNGFTDTVSMSPQFQWLHYNGKNWDAQGQAIWNNDCNIPDTEATPADPSFVDPTCETDGSYTIPETEGVQYKVDGVDASAGAYPITAGNSVTITAVAKDGYVLTGDTEWTHEFSIKEDCVQHYADISYGVVCGENGAIVTLTNNGDIAGEVVLNGEVIAIDPGITVERIIDTEADGVQITIVIDEETVYDQLVKCDTGEILGTSTTAKPKALPVTSGETISPIAALIATIGSALAVAGIATRKVTN